MAGSYLLEDPAGPTDLDDTPCRGYAAASPGGDERSYEVRGGAASWWVGLLEDTDRCIHMAPMLRSAA